MRAFTMSTAEVAKVLGVTRAALCIWRKEGRGPAWREVEQAGTNARFFYDPIGVRAHLHAGEGMIERLHHLEDAVAELTNRLEASGVGMTP